MWNLISFQNVIGVGDKVFAITSDAFVTPMDHEFSHMVKNT